MRQIENKSIDEIVEFFIRLYKSANHLSQSEVKLTLGNFISGYNAKEYRIKINPLTRARKHNKKPMLCHIDEIFAPAKEYVIDYGRFNEISESVFYCSTEPITSLKELKPQKGDIVTLMEFELMSQLDNLLFVGHKVLARNPLLTKLLSTFYDNRDLNQKQMEMNEIIDEIISIHCFSQSIESYKILKAYWQLGQTHMTANGIIYPSFYNSLMAANFVLKPEFIHPLIKPRLFTRIEIKEVRFDHFFEYVVTHEGKLEGQSGNICWETGDNKLKHVTDIPRKLLKFIDHEKFNNPDFFSGEIPWLEN